MVDSLIGSEADGRASSNGHSGGSTAAVSVGVAAEVLVRQVGDRAVVGHRPDVLEQTSLDAVGSQGLEDVFGSVSRCLILHSSVSYSEPEQPQREPQGLQWQR